MSKIFIADKLTLDKSYKLSERIKLNNIAASKAVLAKKSNKVNVLDFVCKDQYFNEINTANTINSKFLSNDNTNQIQEILPTNMNHLNTICRIENINNSDESFLTVNELIQSDDPSIKKYRFDLFNQANKHKERSTYSIKVEKTTDLFSFNTKPIKYLPPPKIIQFDESIDSTSLYFILDGGENRLVALDKDLNFVSENSTFNSPFGMEIDRNNSAIYVTDTHNHVIRAIRADSSLIEKDIFGTIGTPKTDSTGFDNPIDVTVSSNGCVYVIDMANRLVKLSRNLEFISQFGGDGLITNDNFHLNNPTALAYLEGDNTILVYDKGNSRIVSIDADTMKYKDQINLEYPVHGIWANTIYRYNDTPILNIFIINGTSITKYSKIYNSTGIGAYIENEIIDSNIIINDIAISKNPLEFYNCSMHFTNDDNYKLFIPYMDINSSLDNPIGNIAFANLIYDSKFAFNKKLSLETTNLDNFKMIAINETDILFVGSIENKGYYGVYNINSSEKDLKVTKFSDACYDVSLTSFSLDTLKGVIAITIDINDNVKANIFTVSQANTVKLLTSVSINYILNDIKIDLLNSNIFLLSGHNNIRNDETYITLSLKENIDKSISVNINNTYYLKQMMMQSGLVLDNITIKVLSNTVSCRNEKYYIGVSYEKIDTTVTTPETSGNIETEVLGTEVHIAFITIPDINSYSMVYDKNLDLCLNYDMGLGVTGYKFANTKTCIDASYYQPIQEGPLDYNLDAVISVSTTKTVYYINMENPMMIYRNILFNKMVRVYDFVSKLKNEINTVIKNESIGEEQKKINISKIKSIFAKFDNTLLPPDKDHNNSDKIIYRICPTISVVNGYNNTIIQSPDIFLFGNAVNLYTTHVEFAYSVIGEDKSIVGKNPYIKIKNQDIIGVCEYFNPNDTSNVVNVVTNGIAFGIDKDVESPNNPGLLIDSPEGQYAKVLGCRYGSFYGITLPIVTKAIEEKVKPRFIQISDYSIRLI